MSFCKYQAFSHRPSSGFIVYKQMEFIYKGNSNVNVVLAVLSFKRLCHIVIHVSQSKLFYQLKLFQVVVFLLGFR